ncbi:MAG: phage replication initiation protein, NGO0469 family [Pseudomonadota bacterium]
MIISASQTFESAPAGVYPARLFRILDLGTQAGDYQGKPTKARKLLLSFELLGEERMSDGKPFCISRRFTASLSDKAALRAFINQWRGKALTDDEVKAFDLSKMLGAYGFLNLTEATRDGKTYTNIASISPLPKGMPKPEGVNALTLFDMSKPDWSVFDTLGERLQVQIAASPEYHALQGWGDPTPATNTAPKTHAPAADAAEFGDDIPF